MKDKIVEIISEMIDVEEAADDILKATNGREPVLEYINQRIIQFKIDMIEYYNDKEYGKMNYVKGKIKSIEDTEIFIKGLRDL